ncbi:hypothetical protein MTYP_02242 [Methylophilaceae bacterium]|nr:hypothetical protein MTYP_02242 [Methylophilaceae bacterium]
MTALDNAFINALLADASYVRLNQGETFASRLTQPLADFLTQNFEVASQENASDESFSATVWRKKWGRSQFSLAF